MHNSAVTLWSKKLALGGIFVLFVFGLPVCVLAPRALALFLPVASAACLPLALLQAGTAYANRPKHFWLGMTGLTAFLLLGSLRAPDYSAALNVVPGLLLNALSFIVLLIASPLAVSREWVLRWASAGFAVLVILLSIEWLFGMPLNTLAANIEGRAVEPLYTLDRTIIIVSLLIWPLAAYGKAFHCLRRRVILPCILAICWLIFHTSSQAAAVGMVAGIVFYGAGYLLPRLSFTLLRPAIFALFIGAPFLVLLAVSLLPDNQNFWPAANSGERMSIWISTTFEILTQPWFGHGFDALRRIGTDGIPRLHSHNGILQIWLETGFAGIFLASMAITVLLGTIQLAEPRLRPWLMAAFGTWLVVFCVGYNIWQIWWQATALVVIYVFLQVNQSKPASSAP